MTEPSLEPYWLKHQPRRGLEAPQQKRLPVIVSRVAQLDADLLDSELEHVLTEPLYQSLQLFKSSRHSQDYQAALSTLIRYALLRVSLQKYGASYGASLQNLWYTALGRKTRERTPMSQFQLEAYAVLTILPNFLLNRARDAMLSRGWSDYPQSSDSIGLLIPEVLRTNATLQEKARRRRERKRLAWDLYSSTEQAWTLLSLANFVAFLAHGKFRSLLDRMLNIRLVYRHQSFARAVSFEFLNRQLVWEAFTVRFSDLLCLADYMQEFLLFILPLVNLKRLRLRIARFLSTSSIIQWIMSIPRKVLQTPRPNSVTNEKQVQTSGIETVTGEFAHLAQNICPICYSFSDLPGAHIAEPGDPTDPTMGVMVGFSTVADSNSRSALAEVKTPYRVDCCGGLYCYYCIASKLIVWDEERAGLDGGWPCLRCGQAVNNARRAGAEEVAAAFKDERLVH